jgi:hypothetical protein
VLAGVLVSGCGEDIEGNSKRVVVSFLTAVADGDSAKACRLYRTSNIRLSYKLGMRYGPDCEQLLTSLSRRLSPSDKEVLRVSESELDVEKDNELGTERGNVRAPSEINGGSEIFVDHVSAPGKPWRITHVCESRCGGVLGRAATRP